MITKSSTDFPMETSQLRFYKPQIWLETCGNTETLHLHLYWLGLGTQNTWLGTGKDCVLAWNTCSCCHKQVWKMSWGLYLMVSPLQMLKQTSPQSPRLLYEGNWTCLTFLMTFQLFSKRLLQFWPTDTGVASFLTRGHRDHQWVVRPPDHHVSRLEGT